MTSAKHELKEIKAMVEERALSDMAFLYRFFVDEITAAIRKKIKKANLTQISEWMEYIETEQKEVNK